MTELEYEKAGRGPLTPVANEFAWGTARNANYDFTMPASYQAARGGVSVVPGSPMRAGIFATPDSGRGAAGASYWGILELSGNVREQVVSVGQVKGREFAGTHGAGTPEAPKDWPEAKYAAGSEKASGKDDAIGSGLRGGFFADMPWGLRLSDRGRAVYSPRAGSFSVQSRQDQNGWRGVRTAP